MEKTGALQARQHRIRAAVRAAVFSKRW